MDDIRAFRQTLVYLIHAQQILLQVAMYLFFKLIHFGLLLVNHYGCAGDGNHNHAVGLTHRLIAEANAHDSIGA